MTDQTVIGYANLDQFRPLDAQGADIATLRDSADIVAVVEFGPRSKQHIWGDKAGLVVRTRSILSVLNRRGVKIRNRRFVAALIRTETLVFWLVVVHMPPKRFWGRLYWPYTLRLRRFLRSLGKQPKVVIGDWNKNISTDPAGMVKTFGGRWYGDRIDGAWVAPALVKHVTDWTEVPQPQRADRHPFCYLTLED